MLQECLEYVHHEPFFKKHTVWSIHDWNQGESGGTYTSVRKVISWPMLTDQNDSELQDIILYTYGKGNWNLFLWVIYEVWMTKGTYTYTQSLISVSAQYSKEMHANSLQHTKITS